MSLSVPLKTGKTQTIIKKVKISYDDDWVKQHLSALESNYGNAAFFDYYYPGIETILSKKHELLWDLNMESMNWVKDQLGIENNFTLTDDYTINPTNDMRNQSSPKALQYEELIKSNLHYCQVYEYKFGFSYVSSILDLLFCTGPEALNYLSSIPDFELDLKS